MIKRLVALTLIALQSYAFAGFNEGLTAYESKDYTLALQEFRPLAEQGDSMAQFNLGLMYVRGEGVTQDLSEAVAWFSKSADQGNVMAQVNLGNMYANGEGTPTDYAAAVNCYRKAAAQGNTLAIVNLGIFFVKGQGLPQNWVAAYSLFHLAALLDPSKDNDAITKQAAAAKQLTQKELALGKRLGQEMLKNGKTSLQPLDDFLGKQGLK